jgi:hypothetical protein
VHKTELLDKLRREWTRWELQLGGVDEAQATAPGLAGDWSLKDVVAHITRYERWNAAGLGGAPFETPPPPHDVNLDDMDQRNGWFRALDRDLSWSDALSAARDAHAEFEALVVALPDAELQADYTVNEHGQITRATAESEDRWPLWQLIDGDAGAHYEDHANELESWLSRQDS